MAYRGFDLLDVWRGRLSPRKALVLILGLPPDSATRQAMNDGAPLWSRTDHILADAVDAVNAVGWITANKEQERHKRGPFPDPYPRPGTARPARKRITAEALMDFRERTAGNGGKP